MKTLRMLVVSAATACLILLASSRALAEIEIVLQNDFIEQYKDRATIDANYVVDKAHPKPNAPSKDGDLHVAGRADEVKLPIVAEIMNAKDAGDAVDLVHAVEGTGKKVPISGAWRIWCEHGGSSRQVQGGPLEPFETTNPDHVFEIHPITKLKGSSLLSTLREIKGYDPKDAETAFQKYESLRCEIVPGEMDTTIITSMAGYNYVEFGAQLSTRKKDVDDGRLVMAEICDLDGELLVRNRRLVFLKGSEPDLKTREAGDKPVHLLGIPRVDLALVSWRTREAKRTNGNKDVLKWGLPYEIIVVGYYGVLGDKDSGDRRLDARTNDHAANAAVIPRDVEPNKSRTRTFNHGATRLIEGND